MIIAIRISGIVKVPSKVEETLFRLRLRRKYCAVLLEDNNETHKVLKLLRNYVAYGKINPETLEMLIKERARSPEGEIDVKKVVKGLETKSLEELGVKPFFRLHPPRGGMDTKKHFGVNKGVLGDNKESINKLVERML